MAIAAHDRFGPYEILRPAGAGGMGEVYQARDTRLDRVVAIKVSQDKFSPRFEREARAVAALNHPSICQIYDVVLHLRKPVALGECIEGWRVCWLGGWDRGKVFFIVMVSRLYVTHQK